MTTTRPSTARALAYLHCQPFLCTWNFDTPKHFGQFWFRLLFIVIRNPLASGIVDPIGSLIGIWFDILRYVLPSNACLLEFLIGFEMLACKVYKRGKKNLWTIFLNMLWIISVFAPWSTGRPAPLKMWVSNREASQIIHGWYFREVLLVICHVCVLRWRYPEAQHIFVQEKLMIMGFHGI